MRSSKNSSLVNLSGCTYATVVNSNTTLVSAVSNERGIIIERCLLITIGNTGLINLLIDSEILGRLDANDVASQESVIEKVFIPAGKALSINATNAFSESYIYYRVL